MNNLFSFNYLEKQFTFENEVICFPNYNVLKLYNTFYHVFKSVSEMIDALLEN